MSNNIRNRLLALLCFLAFVGAGFFLLRNWVVQKPFAIILFLADGMNAGTLTAARQYIGGAQHRLSIESFPNSALLRTAANDYAAPDSASAATAIATGRQVNSRSLGIAPSGEELPTLIQLAKKDGRSTGIVTNGSLTDPTPGAFYAKSLDARDIFQIAVQLVERSPADLLLGGGQDFFLPDFKGGKRSDGRDLLLELRNKGYDIVRTPSELANTPAWKQTRVFGVFASGDFPPSADAGASQNQPSLSDMVRQAIQLLQFNRRGYFLVVDAGLVERFARSNQAEGVFQEMEALDKAVATALAYAGENALIIVAGKQAVGGLRLNGYPFCNDHGVGLLGMNSLGIPSITWSTGPGEQRQDGGEALEPAAAEMPYAINLVEDTVAVGQGDGSEKLRGFLDSTALFRLIEPNL